LSKSKLSIMVWSAAFLPHAFIAHHTHLIFLLTYLPVHFLIFPYLAVPVLTVLGQFLSFVASIFLVTSLVVLCPTTGSLWC
jgi:hypothetical protein